MEKFKEFIDERGFVSINTFAAHMNKDILESKRIIFSLIQASGDFQALYSEFDGFSYVAKRGVPLSPTNILAVEKVGFDGNAFQVEHDSKPEAKEGLKRQRGIRVQDENKIRPLSVRNDNTTYPRHSFSVLNNPVEGKASESSQKLEKNALKVSKISSQPSFTFDSRKRSKQVQFMSNKDDSKEKFNRIATPYPHRNFTERAIEEILRNTHLSSVEEDYGNSGRSLKRKAVFSTQPNTKFFPSHPTRTSRLESFNTIKSGGYEEAKGRFASEDLSLIHI